MTSIAYAGSGTLFERLPWGTGSGRARGARTSWWRLLKELAGAAA